MYIICKSTFDTLCEIISQCTRHKYDSFLMSFIATIIRKRNNRRIYNNLPQHCTFTFVLVMLLRSTKHIPLTFSYSFVRMYDVNLISNVTLCPNRRKRLSLNVLPEGVPVLIPELRPTSLFAVYGSHVIRKWYGMSKKSFMNVYLFILM